MNNIINFKKKVIEEIEKNKEEEISFLQKLIQISSVNPYLDNPMRSSPSQEVEREVAELIFNQLKKYGLEPKYEGISLFRPNVVCQLGTGLKTLIFNGHMDTVPPVYQWSINPFSGLIKDKKLYGLGSLDMKSALCCYVFMAKALFKFRKYLKGKILLQFVIDEEPLAASYFGTRYLLEKGYQGDAAIIGEPGGRKITIGNRGGYRFKIEVFGKSVHTGSREWERRIEGKNAILDMIKVINQLQKFSFLDKKHDVFPGRKSVVTFPTLISGGKAVNIVPDKCVAIGDMRLLPGITQKLIEKEIKKRLAKLKIKYKLTSIVYVPPVFINKNEPIVHNLKKNIKRILGITPVVEGSGPWSDMWFFIKKGIPAINYGCDGEGMHSGNENVDIESVINTTKIYALTAIDFLNKSD